MINLKKAGLTSGVILLLIAGMTSACFTVDNAFTGMAPGPWRGVLKLENIPVTPNPRGEPLPEKMNLEFEEVTEGELPFTFAVKYLDEDRFYIEIYNGDDTIRVDDITVGLDRKTAKDTVIIAFPNYDSYIKGIFEENVLEGFWVDNKQKNYLIPFEARFGKDHRFTTLKKEPLMDISGKWEVTFEVGTAEEYRAVGEFVQNGNKLTGIFTTEKGEVYPHLEGTVQNDKLYLSRFDGAHAYLLEAKIRPDSNIIGSFRSGKYYRTIWQARRIGAGQGKSTAE